MTNITLSAAWVAVLFTMLAGCDESVRLTSGKPSSDKAFSIYVASNVAPNTPNIGPGPVRTAPRHVARVETEEGLGADFVVDELLVEAPSQQAFESFLGRRRATVLRSFPHPEASKSLAWVHVDLSTASDVDVEAVTQKSRIMGGSHLVSSTQGHALLAIAADEFARGEVSVAANWLTESDAIRQRSTEEGASNHGTWSPDAFSWPYMRRGGVQDMGVAESWRLLKVAGQANPAVTMTIMDGGFAKEYTRSDAVIYPSDAWDRENPGQCTEGNACPWHGTGVSNAALAWADDGYGAAGSGALVGKPVFVQSPDADFLSVLEYIFKSLPSAASASRPHIVNISAGASIPGGVCWFACPALHLVSRLVRLSGILVVASAGNQGEDLDAVDCEPIFGTCWEKQAYVPCELDDVLCVGGLGWNTDQRAGGSNWGSKHQHKNSVDIFGPYQMWGDPTPTQSTVRFVYGTSYSAPFVAGAAALVWAANPSLRAGQVEALLLKHAHIGQDGEVSRWLNAHDAVVEALGGDAPPFARVLSPTAEATYTAAIQQVSLSSYVEDIETAFPSVWWESSRDGYLGAGQFLTRNNLSKGAHTLTVFVQDDYGWVAHDQTAITIVNAPPSVDIVFPNAGASFYFSESIQLTAHSDDPDSNPRKLPEENVTWHQGASSAPLAMGHSASITASALGLGIHALRLRGTDGEDVVERSVTVHVHPDPLNFPPHIEIVSPDPTQYHYADSHDAQGWYKLVTLQAEAVDPEDGGLSGASIRWYSSFESGPEQFLGFGSSVSVKLYAPQCVVNEYRIRAQAEDSSGNLRDVTMVLTIALLC